MSDRSRLKALADEGSPLVQRMIAWRGRWIATARPKQLPPPGDWFWWLILAGRGFGKTRTGAEDMAWYALSNPGVRCAVVGPTQTDTRKICFEGKSGVLNILPRQFISKYNSQDMTLILINGSIIQGYSAEKPDRLRGPEHHRAWCDEIASWTRRKESWDNLILGLRLGTSPKCVLTTTPRPIEFLRDLVKHPKCVVTSGNTFENAANLAADALAMFRQIYEGTRKGLQELYAQILDNSEAALWKPLTIEKHRITDEPDRASLTRIVVAVDPAVTTEEGSDETGIVVAGLRDDGHVVVLEDVSGHYTPIEWARLVLSVYSRWQADAVIAETNQGGDLVEANLNAHADGAWFGFEKVHAKRGKYLRAEPVASLYEKGRVHHVGHLLKLESQMTNFVGSTSKGSPDRLDALVYAVGELALGTAKHEFW
jgi:phage terminase large subunit-like protein